MKLNLNLSDREKARFAGMFRDVAREANTIADNITKYTDGDDHIEVQLAFNMLTFSLCLDTAKEFQKLFMDGIRQSLPKDVVEAIEGENEKKHQREGTYATPPVGAPIREKTEVE